MRILVTGGLGFIGSHLVRRLMREDAVSVVNLDALTYAGNLANLADIADNPRYRWVHASITDVSAVRGVLSAEPFDAVVHLAAESHVDRSIAGGLPFVQTNVVGTEILLEAARECGVPRFLHVSTDEVYGSLGPGGFFTEDSPVKPNSPYSASKAGSDLLVLAAFQTFGQDVVVTRCSNNYGPYQFPEKLIPLYITNG
jgi:dTDP-glucose 4,6-dehydratase